MRAQKSIPAKGRKGPNPQIVFGLAILIFVVLGVFVYFARQRQDADLAAHPTLTHYVLAEGALVGRADEAAMEGQLEKLDQSGAAQVVVVVEESLKAGAPAEEALRIGRRYRIGHAGKNDGVVLLIDAQDKKARIEVGYGLEGVLTDAQSRLIIANEIEPYLASDDFSGAARHGSDAIVALVHPAPLAAAASEGRGIFWYFGVGLFMLVIALIGLGMIQGVILAIPGAGKRIARSRRWGWFARVRIIGGADAGGESSSGGSSPNSIGGGGSFGGGGAQD